MRSAVQLSHRDKWEGPLSTHVTTAPRAALGLADRLTVRAEVFLRLAAPEDTGGKRVFILAGALIEHLLAAQSAAGALELRGIFGRVHGTRAIYE